MPATDEILMFSFNPLTANFAVAGAPGADDLAGVAAKGFATVINFQLDTEPQARSSISDARRAAEALGLTYVHIPAAKHELFTDAVVEQAARVIAGSPGPVLAHCASGHRAAIVWAAAAARTQPVDDVLAVLRATGFDLEFLRDDLEAQADRARWHEAATPPQQAAREYEAA